MLVRNRFGHQHRLSDYIGPCIPNGPIRHKHALGVSAPQQASMPRERLRSINVARWRLILNQCCSLGRSKSFCNNYRALFGRADQYRRGPVIGVERTCSRQVRNHRPLLDDIRRPLPRPPTSSLGARHISFARFSRAMCQVECVKVSRSQGYF